MKEINYRRELKYIIDKREYFRLRGRLSGILAPDEYSGGDNTYRIHSLYFDDIKNTAYFEKLAGVEKRHKYRIRYYNSDTSFIRLEKKVKDNDASYKSSALLSYEQAKNAVIGNYEGFFESESPLLREFYLADRHSIMMPSIITDYKREAYVFSPSNVRITFDSDIRTGLSSMDIFDESLPLFPVMGPDQMVLEVKYDINLPKLITDLLKGIGQSRTAVSKYTLCKRYIKHNDWEVDRWD